MSKNSSPPLRPICVRTAARATPVERETLINVMHGNSRAQGHEKALLEKVRDEQKELSFEIDFPFDIDMQFCNRDDWGTSPTAANLLAGGAYLHGGLRRF